VREQPTLQPGPAVTAGHERRAAWRTGTLVAAGQLRSGNGVLGRLFGAIVLGLGPSGGGGNSPDREADLETDEATAVTEAVDGEAIAELLVAQSVLAEDDGCDDLRLTGGFQSDWWRRIERVRDDERALMQLAMLIGVDPDEVQLEGREGRFVAHRGGREVGAWPSRAAFLADVALYPTIEEWVPAWTELDGEQRGELLARLRAFLERCPHCRGTLRADEEDGTDHVAVSITCTDCGQVIVTGSY